MRIEASRAVSAEALQGDDSRGNAAVAGSHRAGGGEALRSFARSGGHQAAGRRGVCLCVEHQPLHRVPALRARVRGGKQPVAPPGDSVHPCAENGKGQYQRRDIRSLLRPGGDP